LSGHAFKSTIIKQGWLFPVCRSYVMFMTFLCRVNCNHYLLKISLFKAVSVIRYKANKNHAKTIQYQCWTLYYVRKKKVLSTLFTFRQSTYVHYTLYASCQIILLYLFNWLHSYSFNTLFSICLVECALNNLFHCTYFEVS
jgi:hypothetical protein